ncbi:MAG: hypothetical protein GEU74_03430 [Nitriliruptorales bacterium]|nr:hypothetical protein [Nitriliruptorales bacterium]
MTVTLCATTSCSSRASRVRSCITASTACRCCSVSSNRMRASSCPTCAPRLRNNATDAPCRRVLDDPEGPNLVVGPGRSQHEDVGRCGRQGHQHRRRHRQGHRRRQRPLAAPQQGIGKARTRTPAIGGTPLRPLASTASRTTPAAGVMPVAVTAPCNAVAMSVVERLSPSKINMFRQCPQHFAFRYIERLEEPDDPRLVRGTLVHEVCERLFDLPPHERTRPVAVALLHRLWERMVDAEPALAALFADADAAGEWIVSAEALVATWFRLEAPSTVAVQRRELFVETTTEAAVLSGIIDRLDRLDDGTWAITDYKTGPAPGARWELQAFFQLRFYALVVARSLGLNVTLLRLVHLARNGEVLELPFEADSVDNVDRQVVQLAAAMQRASESGRWHANVGRQCDWCGFRDRCPAWSDARSEP